MVYIDIKDEKEKKKLSAALDSMNINHNDIALSYKKSNDIVICDNDINTILENHKIYKKVVVFNKNKSPLTDEIYYDKGVYSYITIEELETILKVFDKMKVNNITQLKKFVTVSFVLVMFAMVLVFSPKLLKE